MKVHPYLNFDGQAEEAFEFYRFVFGREFLTLQRMADGPDNPNLTSEDHDRIMYIALPIAENTVLMASDVLTSAASSLDVGNNVHILLEPEKKAEADRLFQALSEGGEIELHLREQFWGDYFGSCTDKFGIKWMVSCSEEA
ncbi:VOC family protein [Pricia sp. S334]|uniref:VOC family protein n=1 Tax=Pricia mediterranea TaxID=3076079 RepID=A0ABU3L1Y5_9FLAO|nr:VOC family protein [Pricia sp. S334]MDT7827598.1 VOC family protein [Pricia sp. S334]